MEMHDADRSTDMTPDCLSSIANDNGLTANPKLKWEGVAVTTGAKGDKNVVLSLGADGSLEQIDEGCPGLDSAFPGHGGVH